VPENKVSNIIDNIRGGFPEGTMWEVDKKQLEALREKIAEHVCGVTP
jgi:hypothetical protein